MAKRKTPIAQLHSINIWNNRHTYNDAQRPSKTFSKEKHENYQPDGETPLRDLIQAHRLGMHVPVHPLEYGDDELNPLMQPDLDLADRHEIIKQSNKTMEDFEKAKRKPNGNAIAKQASVDKGRESEKEASEAERPDSDT